MKIAHIRFKGGMIRACTGTVTGGIQNVSPGRETPWTSLVHVVSHCERNGLELVRVEGWPK